MSLVLLHCSCKIYHLSQEQRTIRAACGSVSDPELLVCEAQAHYLVSGLRKCVALAGTPTCSFLAVLLVLIVVVNLSKLEKLQCVSLLMTSIQQVALI